MAENIFQQLNTINVSDKTEKKNGLTYLSWSWAWAELKKKFPYSFYTIYENEKGWNYFTDGKTCWVKTGVTLVEWDGKPATPRNEVEAIEYLPIMDFRNRSIPLDNITSMDVNKAIQRSLTKAAARHGCGLYIYSGEDLPEEDPDIAAAKKAAEAKVKELIAKIDETLVPLTKKMTKEEKMNLLTNTVVPIVGQQNYRMCKDAEKLSSLLN